MEIKTETTRAEENGEKGAYEKTLLYLYPHMEKMSEALDTSLRTQALLSYRRRESAEALVERLLQSDFQSSFLLRTRERLEDIFSGFTREEMFVLEYRYFRRRKFLREYEEAPVEMSVRTFYRRQHSILKKFSAALKLRGMDEKWFAENFSEMDWAMKVYKKVCAGRDSYLLGRHKENPLCCIKKSGEGKEKAAASW